MKIPKTPNILIIYYEECVPIANIFTREPYRGMTILHNKKGNQHMYCMVFANTLERLEDTFPLRKEVEDWFRGHELSGNIMKLVTMFGEDSFIYES
jgi:hypothetical protein